MQSTSDQPSSTKIIELRELLAARFPGAVAPPTVAGERLVTGVHGLDAALEGGLHKGTLTEIVAPVPSTGSGVLIQALIAAARAADRRLALVDGGHSFCPDGLDTEQLAALLWVRCAKVEQAQKAADLLLRDGNLPLLVLDLVACREREVRAIPSACWYRLQRACEGNGATALVFTKTPVVAGAARTLRLARQMDLSILDVLRRDLLTQLRLETLHRRAVSRFDSGRQPVMSAAG